MPSVLMFWSIMKQAALPSLTYCILVTGPAYGTQQASSAYQFSQALLQQNHKIITIFFYQQGVFNANQLVLPANDECHLISCWQALAQQYGIALDVCLSAALRRGVVDELTAKQYHLTHYNLHEGFRLSGLGSLAEAMLHSDRVIQF